MAARAGVEEIRARNRAAVLGRLRRDGPLSRTALAAATGLSGASLSSIAADLLAEGLIAADALVQGGRGRPQAPLRIDGRRAATLALFVSADAVRLRLSDYAGATLAESAAAPLPADADADATLDALRARIADFLAEAPSAPPLVAVALAVQGVMDRDGRRLIWSPILRPRDLDLAAPLTRSLGATVTALNDCSAMAEALLWTRPDLGPDFAVILTGAGVGMGLALGGAVFEGRASSALEFGHVTHIPGGAPCRCGRAGCVEAYVADYGLARAAGGSDPAPAARAGDPAARAAFEAAGAALGYGAARLFALFGPLRLALAGPGARDFDLMAAGFRKALGEGLAPELSAEPEMVLIPDASSVALDGAALHARARLDAAFARRAPLEGAA
jgi:predicted NBD/HSP70 family sugar kinase